MTSYTLKTASVCIICFLINVSLSFAQNLNPKLVIQQGHSNTVKGLEFSSSGNRLLSISEDDVIKIWDLKSRMLINSIETLNNYDLVDAQFGVNDETIISMNDEYIFHIHVDGTIIKKTPVNEIHFYTNRSIFKCFREKNVMVLSAQSKESDIIQLRDLTTGELKHTLDVGNTEFKSFTEDFTKDSQSLLFTDKNSIYKYDLGSNKLSKLYKYKKKKDAVLGSYVFKDKIYLPTTDGILTILNANYEEISNEQIIFSEDYFYAFNHTFGITSDGSFLFCDEENNYDYSIHKKNASYSDKIPIDERFFTMAIHRDNNIMAIAQSEKISIYDTNNLNFLYSFDKKVNWYKLLKSLNKRGQFITNSTNSSNIYHWDLKKGKVKVIKATKGDIRDVAISHNGDEALISMGYENTFYDLPEFEKTDTIMITNNLERLYGNAYVIKPGNYDVVYSKDDQTFATEYGEGLCGFKIWDRKTKDLLYSNIIDQEPYFVEHLDYNAELGLVLIETQNQALWNRKTRLYDLKNKQAIGQWDNVLFHSKFFPTSKKAVIPTGILDLEKLTVNDYGINWFSADKPDVSSDEKYLSYLKFDSIYILNLTSNKHYAIGKHHEVEGAVFLKDEHRLVSFGRNGALKLWDIEAQELIATIFAEEIDDFSKKKELSYLIFTPDGYYMGPRTLQDLAAYNIDNKIYTFDQFDLIYNRPDIVLKRLGYQSPKQLMTYKQAYNKRKLNIKESQIPSLSKSISIKIENILSIPSKTKNKHQLLKLSLTDTIHNIVGYNIWVNGVPTYGTTLKKIEKPSKTYNLEEKIPLVNGNNYIEISAINSVGEISLKETLKIDCESPARKDLYIVGVGMSKYKDDSYNLKYPGKDVKDLTSYLSDSRYFEHTHSLIIKDTLFTKSSASQISNFIQNTTPDDQIVVFYAGHGLLDENDYYLSTYDIDFNNPKVNGFKFENLEAILENALAREKIILIDACHSGLVDESSKNKTTISIPEDALSTAKDTIQRLDKRGGKLIDNDQKEEDAFNLMQSLFTNLNLGSGTSVISAAGGTQYAYESNKYSNGLFTYAYLQGLKTGKADLNEDGNINITEIKSYVEDLVLKLSKGDQRPALRQLNYFNDFTVWATKDNQKNYFFNAAKENNISKIEKYLNLGFDINMKDKSNKFTALHYAVRDGANNFVKFLIENKASIDEQSLMGWTPLHLAAHNNNYQGALLLLYFGANPNIADNNGITPLIEASDRNNSSIVDLLNNRKTIIEELKRYNNVFESLRKDDLESFQVELAKSELDIDFVNPLYDLSLLHMAGIRNNVMALEYLMEKNANLDVVNSKNVTALMYASYFKNYEALEYLLKNGADKSLKDITGYTAYNYADKKAKIILDKY
jgi:ankyrin repeat protein/WD40 repeat protein